MEAKNQRWDKESTNLAIGILGYFCEWGGGSKYLTATNLKKLCI